MNKSSVDLKLLAPKFIKSIEHKIIDDLALEEEGCYNDFILVDKKIKSKSMHLLNFEGVIFRNVDFTDITWSSLSLTNVRFENCDLSNADFSGAIIHKSEFIGCKLMGLNLRESALQNVRLENCKASFIFMRFARLKQVYFERCQMESSDFQYAELVKVMFEHSTLRLSQFSGTKLADIDLSNCDIEGLGVRIEDLKGAIVSPGQAVDFSKLFGLVVKP